MAIFSDRTLFKRSWPQMFGVDRIFDYLTSQGGSYVGMVQVVEVAVAAADLLVGGTKTIFAPAAGESWKVINLWTLGGTNFAAGGDRLLDIKSDTAIYSRIPNASIETLAFARWGDTALPAPGTLADGLVAFTATNPLVAAYQGGATDNATGSVTVRAQILRTA